MRARFSKASLTEVAAICGLRRLATERDASRAAQALRAAKERLDERKSERSAAERDWQHVVSMPSLWLEMLRASSFRLLQQEHAVTGAVSDVDRATQECDRRLTGWYKASRQHDVVVNLLHQAAKTDALRREEASLEQALHRHAHRGEDA